MPLTLTLAEGGEATIGDDTIIRIVEVDRRQKRVKIQFRTPHEVWRTEVLDLEQIEAVEKKARSNRKKNKVRP